MKARFYIFFNWLVVLSILSASWPIATQAAPLTLASTPEPLPNDCIGVTPPGEPIIACCLYVYVYFGTEIVNNASVSVQSSHGTINGVTAPGIHSAHPYFNSALSSAPLLTTPGEVITITVSYNGMVSVRTWTVQNNAQQVDVELVAPVTTTPTTQYLINPSFEARVGFPTNWAFVGPCNYYVYEDGNVAHDGIRYLATNKNSNSSCYSFRQNISGLTPVLGQTYRFSMWVRSSEGTERKGEIVIWTLSGGTIEHSQGNGNFSVTGTDWKCVETYLTVTNPGNTLLRGEMYLYSQDNIDYRFDQGTFTVGGGNLCPTTPPAPQAAFTASPFTGLPPLGVSFTDQSSGDITGWTWDFGDGFTSGARYPYHTYQNGGLYSVSLTVSGPGGQDIETKSNYIAVMNDVHSLILVNRQKIAELYGDAEADMLLGKLNMLASDTAVNGLVVQLENDPDITVATAARGTDYSNKDKANALAEAIRQVIREQWDIHPNLKYVVFVGDDRALPFYRIKDGTWYPDPWTLTDDFYADQTPTFCKRCANSIIYIPDLATGRLVETPSQIRGQIDTFLASNILNLNSGIVTGYDFIQDGAQAHCNTLRTKGFSPDCTLIGANWTTAQFTSQVLNTYHATCSINAHANESGFGTPSGFVYATDFVNSSIDFSRAIFYTVGCHAGLNVPNGLDLPEGMAIKKIIYIANTGFGWGGGGVVLSEELTWNFTKKLVLGSQITPGDALMLAKQQYYTDHPQPDKYDEKITTEFTLYGLPMYQVNTSAVADAKMKPGSFQVQSTKVNLANGLTQESKFFSFPLPIPEKTEEGTFYSLNGMIAANEGEPLLPLLSYEVGKPDLKLIGLVFTGGAFTTVSATPPIQHVITTNMEPELTGQNFSAPGWYPSLFATTHRLELADGAKETIWAMAGQYNPTLSTNQQRIFTGMSFDLYYLASPNDLIAPKLTAMHSQLDNSASIQVTAADASGIQAVVIAYTDGVAAWHSVSLAANGGRWIGNFPADTNTEFFIQIVDKAGNVTSVDKNGQYFHPGDNFLNKLYLPLTVR